MREKGEGEGRKRGRGEGEGTRGGSEKEGSRGEGTGPVPATLKYRRSDRCLPSIPGGGDPLIYPGLYLTASLLSSLSPLKSESLTRFDSDFATTHEI